MLAGWLSLIRDSSGKGQKGDLHQKNRIIAWKTRNGVLPLFHGNTADWFTDQTVILITGKKWRQRFLPVMYDGISTLNS